MPLRPRSVPPGNARVGDREHLLAAVHASPVSVYLERDTASSYQLVEPGHVDTEQTGRLRRADPVRRIRVEREPGARELQRQRLSIRARQPARLILVGGR